MSEKSAVSSLTMKCDEHLFELTRLHDSNSSLLGQSKNIFSKNLSDISSI